MVEIVSLWILGTGHEFKFKEFSIIIAHNFNIYELFLQDSIRDEMCPAYGYPRGHNHINETPTENVLFPRYDQTYLDCFKRRIFSVRIRIKKKNKIKKLITITENIKNGLISFMVFVER